MAQQDPEQPQLQLDPLNQKLQELGIRVAFGMDAPRFWANGMQTFPQLDETIFVFREQVNGDHGVELQNRVSVVLPTTAALLFRDQLVTLFGAEGNALADAAAAEAKKNAAE